VFSAEALTLSLRAKGAGAAAVCLFLHLFPSDILGLLPPTVHPPAARLLFTLVVVVAAAQYTSMYQFFWARAN
jgi:hypothetical protein